MVLLINSDINRYIPAKFVKNNICYFQYVFKLCRCTKFLHRMGHVLIHGRAKHGLSLCVWGCWVQNSTPSVVDHLVADGAFPSSAPWSTRLQCSHKGLRWTNETNAADQDELIILLPPEHSAITNTVVIIHVEYITDLLTNK